MNVRFVSQDMSWTESMKSTVRTKIVEPLAGQLKKGDPELSIHLEIGWTRTPNLAPRFELWVVLQTFDGKQNALVRRAGANFASVAEEVLHGLRTELKRSPARPTSSFSFP